MSGSRRSRPSSGLDPVARVGSLRICAGQPVFPDREEDHPLPPYSGSEEIYRELVEESEESWLYGLTAYAIIEEQRREVEQGMIVGEIRSLKRFWPQFGMSLGGGFVGAMLFAALLGLLTFFVSQDAARPQRPPRAPH